MSDKFVEMQGVVVDSLGNGLFSVKINSSETVIVCSLSGNIRKNKIRILSGDPVKVHVSPYDLTHGRIVWRQ